MISHINDWWEVILNWVASFVAAAPPTAATIRVGSATSRVDETSFFVVIACFCYPTRREAPPSAPLPERCGSKLNWAGDQWSWSWSCIRSFPPSCNVTEPIFCNSTKIGIMVLTRPLAALLFIATRTAAFAPTPTTAFNRNMASNAVPLGKRSDRQFCSFFAYQVIVSLTSTILSLRIFWYHLFVQPTEPCPSTGSAVSGDASTPETRRRPNRSRRFRSLWMSTYPRLRRLRKMPLWTVWSAEPALILSSWPPWVLSTVYAMIWCLSVVLVQFHHYMVTLILSSLSTLSLLCTKYCLKGALGRLWPLGRKGTRSRGWVSWEAEEDWRVRRLYLLATFIRPQICWRTEHFFYFTQCVSGGNANDYQHGHLIEKVRRQRGNEIMLLV